MSKWTVTNSETHVTLKVGEQEVNIPIDDSIPAANAVIRATRMTRAHLAQKAGKR